jgi:hypothetical protein
VSADATAQWVNEKLSLIRAPWNRHLRSDLLLDVEAARLLGVDTAQLDDDGRVLRWLDAGRRAGSRTPALRAGPSGRQAGTPAQRTSNCSDRTPAMKPGAVQHRVDSPLIIGMAAVVGVDHDPASVNQKVGGQTQMGFGQRR